MQEPYTHLIKKEWKDNCIQHNGRVNLLFDIVRAAAFTAPVLVFALNEKFMSNLEMNIGSLMLLVFPIVAMAATVRLIKNVIDLIKFGATPLALSPFPGSLEGHIGGRMNCKIPYDSNLQFHVTLRCIRSFLLTTENQEGGYHKRQEVTIWESGGTCVARPIKNGSEASFRFSPPSGLPETESEDKYVSHLW